MKEQDVQSKIIKTLEKEESAYVVNGVYTRSGIPDLIACVPFTKEEALRYLESHDTIGVFLGVEVKKPEEWDNTTKLQEYNLGKIQSLGGLSLVAWTKEMVQKYLKENR